MLKITSNVLAALVKIRKKIVSKHCLKLSKSHAGSLIGSEFQIIGSATRKARRPYVLSRQRGTTSQCRRLESYVLYCKKVMKFLHNKVT